MPLRASTSHMRYIQLLLCFWSVNLAIPLTLPKKRSSLGRKCCGQMLSRYHSKLLHFSLSRSSIRDLTLWRSLSRAAPRTGRQFQQLHNWNSDGAPHLVLLRFLSTSIPKNSMMNSCCSLWGLRMLPKSWQKHCLLWLKFHMGLLNPQADTKVVS